MNKFNVHTANMTTRYITPPPNKECVHTLAHVLSPAVWGWLQNLELK